MQELKQALNEYMKQLAQQNGQDSSSPKGRTSRIRCSARKTSSG